MSTSSISPNLTYSTGSTSITYSIIAYSSSMPAPSWVSIDSSSKLLTISTPNVTSTESFPFYISSAVSGVSTPVLKLVNVTVLACSVSYCSICSSQNVCYICNSGSQLTSAGGCSAPSTSQPVRLVTTRMMTAIAQAAVGLVAGVLGLFNLVNISSLASLWSMINQMQIYLLLLLTRAYIPDDVRTVITGAKFLTNPFSLINVQLFPIIRSFFENFHFYLTNSNLEAFGINSDSSIYNTAPLLLYLIIVVLFHFCLKALKRMLVCWSRSNRCSCLQKLAKWAIDKSFDIMTYGYYVRLLLQMNQFLLITSVYEIYTFNVLSTNNKVSFAFSFFVFFYCLLFVGLTMYLSLSPYKASEDNYNKIGEIFVGVKMDKKFKLFIPLIMVRRTVFIIILIFLVSIPSQALIFILTCIQLCYFFYLCFMRPFKEVKSNIIEIINEIYFTILLIDLIAFNQESEWTSAAQSIYWYYGLLS